MSKPSDLDDDSSVLQLSGPEAGRATSIVVWVGNRAVTVTDAASKGDLSVAAHDSGAVDRPGFYSAAQIARYLNAIALIQAESADVRRPELVKAMLIADIDTVPPGTIDQAHRLAHQRNVLLASGAYPIDALAAIRGDSTSSATRTWLSRLRKNHELFSVSQSNATYVPAFQLDGTVPRPEVATVLGVLAPIELGDWATWTWFTSGSPWLGGATPVELLDSEPERVEVAARRFVSNAE